jgi:hypothetical protein
MSLIAIERPSIRYAATERPGMNRAFRVSLFLLLTLRMSLLAMLVCGLRVLFGAARVLPALGVVTLAVMFGGGTMCLGSVFVVFGSLVVFFSCHGNPHWLLAPSPHKLAVYGNVPDRTAKDDIKFSFDVKFRSSVCARMQS